jgi:hypothetical protein
MVTIAGVHQRREARLAALRAGGRQEEHESTGDGPLVTCPPWAR